MRRSPLNIWLRQSTRYERVGPKPVVEKSLKKTGRIQTGGDSIKSKGIRAVQRIGIFVVLCLLCSCLSALADSDCRYYAANGTHDVESVDDVLDKKAEQARPFTGFESNGIACPQTRHAAIHRIAISQTPTETPPPASRPESGDRPATDPPVAVDFCTRYLDETGANRIAYCPDHARIIAKYEARKNLAETDEARLQVLKECRLAWQSELERLYDGWLENASADDKPGIAQAKNLFLFHLQTQESMWMNLHSGQPMIIQQQIIDALTEQCVDLCALAADNTVLMSFSFSHSGMSTDTIYTYSVLQTEQGYQAEYSLYCDRDNFSFLMDEEDVANLLVMAKALTPWDGFHETNPYVSDGEGFSLQIAYGNGVVISASGNNAFPQGYHDTASGIAEYFLNLMDKHKIVIDE